MPAERGSTRTGERRMANAAEFLARRWKVRYIDAEGRILEELDTTIAECVEDANEEGFSREDLYRVPEIVTRGRFPDGGESDSTWRTQEARHVGSDTIAPGF